MKLVKQNRNGFQYQLSQEEAFSLRHLVSQFPVAGLTAAKISKTDLKTADREKLLNESLTVHRNELKRKAGDLVSTDKFRTSGNHQFFRINPEERETMLQVLNDIRIESWRILGEPEDLDINIVELPKDKIRHYHVMHLSGYFEHHFLNLEDEEK
jgi:hypothetical protein